VGIALCVALPVLAGCGSDGATGARSDPADATRPTATTLAPGIPPPDPFGTGQLIGLGEWELFVGAPVAQGPELRVPVRLSNQRAKPAALSTDGLFTLQDGVSGSVTIPPVAIEGLAGPVAAGATVEGVVVFRPDAPLATPTLFFHGDQVGGQPAYVQLAGAPPPAP
jgi:hypothetical protein